MSLLYCLKCESAIRSFQPGEGPSRGLLRDCEIFANLRLTFVCSGGVSAADVVWLLIWLLQPRYQSRQVNTALGFTTTTTNHQQPDTDTQHGLRFNTNRGIQKYGFRVVLGYYYNDLGSPYLYVIFSVLVESCYTEASGQALISGGRGGGSHLLQLGLTMFIDNIYRTAI